MNKIFLYLYNVNEYFIKFTLKSLPRIQNAGYVAIIISYIQIFIIILEQTILFSIENSNDSSKISICRFLVSFTNPISILFLQHNAESCNNFVIYIYPLLFLGFIVLILYFLEKVRTEKAEVKGNELWGFICYIYEKCLYIFIFRFSLSLITSSIYFGTECNQGILTVNIIINLVNIAFSGWLCYFALPIMHFQYKHSMKSRKTNFINLAYKTLAAFIIDIYYIIGNNWIALIAIIFQFLYLILTFYLVCIKLVFYSKQMEKIIGSLLIVTFTLTLISIVNYFSLKVNNESQIWTFYVCIISIPFLIKLKLNLSAMRINKILITPMHNIQNEDHMIIKLIHTYDSFCKVKFKYEQETFDFLKVKAKNKFDHQLNDESNFNLLDSLEEYDLNNKNYLSEIFAGASNTKILFTLMNKVYRYGIKRFPHSILIRIIFLNYLNMNKNIKSIEHLSTIIISQIYSIINENNLFIKVNLQILQADNAQYKSSTINILRYMALTNTIKDILKRLENALMKYLDFWKMFNSKDSGNAYLLLYSEKANQQYNQIMKILKDIENKKGDDHSVLMFTKPLLFISIFIIVGWFNNSMANKYTQLYYYIQKKIEKICQIEALNNETLFDSNNNIYITVSGNKKTLGNILTCSSSISKHLGYDPKRLLGQNVLVLLPKSLQKIHHQCLTNFLVTGNSYVLHKIRTKPVMNENRTIRFVDLYTQVSPLLDHGLSFIGFFRPIHSRKQSILLTYDGQIDGISEKLSKLFPSNEEKKEISFLKMTEGYSHIHHVFNFIRFIETITAKAFTNKEELMKMYNVYQSCADDDLEILMAFEAIQKIISCFDCLEELIPKIMNMKEYSKIKRIYDQYSVEAINFKLKINNDDCVTYYLIKCNLYDEIYQNHQFLRILDITDIHFDSYDKIAKSNRTLSHEEIYNMDMDDRKISTDIYGYNNLYQKKTKTEIENNIFFSDTKNNPRNYIEDTNHIQNNQTSNILPILDQNNKVKMIEPNNIQFNINTNVSHLSNINIIKVNQKASTSILTIQFTKNYLEKKINEAFDYVYVSDLNKFTIFMIVSFALISIILGIITYSNQIKIEFNYLQNTNALYSWNIASKHLMQISYVVNEIWCTQNGYIPLDIWAFLGLSNLLDTDILYVSQDAIMFTKYVEDFANEIYFLPEDLRDKIFQIPINITDVDPITLELNPNYITQDVISASYELINKLIHVGAIPYEKKGNTTSDIIYVINNIYGDMCISQEKINNLIFQAITNNYDNLQNEKVVKFIIIISLGIFCLLVLRYQTRQYYKKQYHFLKNLIKLQSQNTIYIQKNIENALEFLKHDPMEEDLIAFKNKVQKQNKISQIATENNQTYKQNIQFFNINTTLINRRNYLKGILGLCLISTFILMFLLDYLISKRNQTQNEINTLRFIETLNRYTNNSLAVGLFYVYLASNGTATFRNNNISVELETLYNSKADTSHFRSIFLDENQNYEYSQYLFANACVLVAEKDEEYCVRMGSQRNQYGIFAMEEWMGNTLLLLKQSFDSSNRSMEVILEFFSSKVFVELIDMDLTVQIYPYNLLFAAIKQDIDHKIIQDRQKNVQFTILSVVSFLLSILIFGYPLSKKIWYEYTELKLLLKMFPIRIFLKHTYFKNFIFLTSRQILQNIRNLLQKFKISY